MSLPRLLLDPYGTWAHEAADVYRTGLATGSWVATDQTSTSVDGQDEVCHVGGNACSSLPPTLIRRVGNALPRDTDMTAADLQQHLITAKLTLNRQHEHVTHRAGVAVPSAVLSSTFGENTFIQPC